jgi:putative proteasome-type protease
MVEHRYEKADLLEMSTWWQERLRRSVHELPAGGLDHVFAEMAVRATRKGASAV